MTDHLDALIGQNMRQRRWMTKMTQNQLAEAVGVDSQQIQEYETGDDRVPANRLFDIAQVLDVPMTFFFREPEITDEYAVPKRAEKSTLF